MGAKGTTHTPADQRNPKGWPHTQEQLDARRKRMREYVRDKRANDPEYVAKQRAYHQSERGKQVRADASNRFKRARRVRLQEIKMAAGCTDCGFNAHPAALQFDHVRGEKVFELGSKTSMAWSRMEEEIAKCDVVCANCHAIRTAERRGRDLMGFADDYVPVADRIIAFRERFPEGSLRPANPAEPFCIVEVGGQTFLAYTAAAYRTPDDPAPGIGCAWEPVPGKTNFTRNSELQNAESSAWGRALIAVGAADAKRGIASSEDVRNRQAEEEYYNSVEYRTPGFRTSVIEATKGLSDERREELREWLAAEGLPDRPALMNEAQCEMVVEWIMATSPT